LRILYRLKPAASHDHGHSHSHGHGDAQSHGHLHDHDHGPGHDHRQGPDHSHAHGEMDEDAHAAFHAAEVRKQVAKGPVTNADVAWFGFSGGLIPCPAAFAVLLACFHQKAYGLGVVMVAAFSIGLALMLVAIGVIAAWGAKTLASRQSGLDRFARWAPLASAAVVLVIGLVVTAQGLAALRVV
jgi:nickel/cobalt transporter (NicO) family protein